MPEGSALILIQWLASLQKRRARLVDSDVMVPGLDVFVGGEHLAQVERELLEALLLFLCSAGLGVRRRLNINKRIVVTLQ